jgi:hypothetical protein
VTTGDQIESSLALVAGLIEWSQTAGVRGDHAPIWRRHDVLLARLHRSGATREGPLARVLRLEVAAWTSTLHAALSPEVLHAVAEQLAPDGSGTWSALEPERRRLMLNAAVVRTRVSTRTFASSVHAFLASPSTAHLHAALRGLEQLIDVERPRTRAVPAGVSARELDRLVGVLERTLPPIALELLAAMVEERFVASIDQPSLRQISNATTRRLERRWTPSWERLEAGGARVEACSSWFVPETQRRYEELRWSRELEQAHAEALVEEEHRAREIAEELDRRAEAERLAREEVARAEAEDRLKEERLRLAQLAKEQAKRNVINRLMDERLTLKHVPEPERTKMLEAEERRLRQKWGC